MQKLCVAALLILMHPFSSQADQKWVTLRGQVIWPRREIPGRRTIQLHRGKRPTNKGPLLDSTWVIHPKSKGIRWMKAYVRVFNHPYHTVTDENGNFELNNVPVGDNVRLVFWHRTGWCVGDFRHGIKIPAPKNGVVDLGKVKILPEEDECDSGQCQSETENPRQENRP